MIDYHQQPQAACCAPRWKVNRDFTLDIETNMAGATVTGLKDLGHPLKSVQDPYMDFGAGQFIWRMSENDNELATWPPATAAATARPWASDGRQPDRDTGPAHYIQGEIPR